jgi:hypothetical protein
LTCMQEEGKQVQDDDVGKLSLSPFKDLGWQNLLP